MNTFDNTVNSLLSWVHGKNALPIISILVASYVVVLRPKLPKFIENLFENAIFRFIVIAYILYRRNHDASSAIMITIAFLVIIHVINSQKINELINSRKPKEIKSRSESEAKPVNNVMPESMPVPALRGLEINQTRPEMPLVSVNPTSEGISVNV